jgi:beta-N-acetylhexosaminidase
MTMVSATAPKDTLGQVRRRLHVPPFGPTALAIIAGLGIAAAVQDFRSDGSGAGTSASVPEAGGGGTGPRERTSFLAKLIPPPPEKVEGPSAPSSIEDLARRLPLERKVAQLFLLGFEGQDLTAPIFRQMRRQDLGGLVFENRNYLDLQQIAAMAGEGKVIAADEGHVPPFVAVSQEGGEFSEFPDLPPAQAPSEFANVAEAEQEATDAGTALAALGFNTVLAPVVDVGTADGTGALDERAFSDDPAKVADYGAAVVHAYDEQNVMATPKHFPGLGAAGQAPEDGPTPVGLTVPELRERDMVPFEAAFDAGALGVVISHGSYTTDDFVTPGSLSKAIATDILREELEFRGVSITDDLASPAVTAISSIPDAAVEALKAGVDLVWISGPRGDQDAAMNAVLNAVRSGDIPRERIDQALLRSLTAKQALGLIDG